MQNLFYGKKEKTAVKNIENSNDHQVKAELEKAIERLLYSNLQSVEKP